MVLLGKHGDVEKQMQILIYLFFPVLGTINSNFLLMGEKYRKSGISFIGLAYLFSLYFLNTEKSSVMLSKKKN